MKHVTAHLGKLPCRLGSSLLSHLSNQSNYSFLRMDSGLLLRNALLNPFRFIFDGHNTTEAILVSHARAGFVNDLLDLVLVRLRINRDLVIYFLVAVHA